MDRALKPEIRFFPGDRLVVSQGRVIVECRYWVQWGEQIWNIEIISVQGAPMDDAHIVTLIAQALTAKTRLVIKRDDRVIAGSEKSVLPPNKVV